MTGEPAAPVAPAPPAPTPTRDLDLRLARIHLRTGLLAIARAELESFVGSGELDAAGLLDLAEVRWRTGDRAGAGDAAIASLERRSDRPLALLIAAEAAAAAGRADEALDLADRARHGADGRLDELFAGMPRSPIWPAEGGLTVIVSEPEPIESPPPAAPVRPPAPVGAWDARSELAEARAELSGGRVGAAALRLALVLRSAPEQAPAVIAAIGWRTDPTLALVLGDAHRITGNDELADRAWAAARASLGAPPDQSTDSPAPDPAEPEAASPSKETP
jgi:hypothetical protein